MDYPKQNKIEDKEVQTNGFEHREEDFQENLSERGEIYLMVKDITDEETEKEFKRKGIQRVEKVAGYYADGSTYGSGVQEHMYDQGVFRHILLL